MRIIALLPLALLASCQTKPVEAGDVPPAAEQPPEHVGPANTDPVRATEVRDQAALERLRGNGGITLQWITWDRRGTLEVRQNGKVVRLTGSQSAPDGKGRLEIDGDLVSIDADHFIFRGRIAITDTPDVGRRCVKNGDSHFAITQGRRYWRLREFEWCDVLTDYIDIYFN